MDECYCLFVDDEVTENENDVEDTIRQMKVPKHLALFASNYDDAVEILTSERNIVICYVDYKIPKNNQYLKANYDDDLDRRWGLELIPQIKALKSKASIVVYSAYVTEEYLQNASGESKNLVTAFFEKPHGLNERRKYYLEAINNNSSNLLKYGELDQQTQDFLLDRTNKIQGLIQKTVENMLEMGNYLNEVKQILQHGQFIVWYETQIKLSNATVWRMMNAAKRLENYAVEDLVVFGLTTLYELTDPDIPDRVLDAIIQDKQLAKLLSHHDAKKIRKYFKTQKKERKQDIEIASKTLSIEAIIQGEELPKLSSYDDTKQEQEQDIEIASRLLSSASSIPVINDQTTESSTTSSITNDRERRLELTSGFKNQDTSGPKQDIVRVIPKQRVWRIGDNQQHVIIAAEPNSPDFLRELPASIALCLAFPPTKNWQFQLETCNATNIFHSNYQDFEREFFFNMTDELIKNTTNDYDNVAICYIPEAKILSIVHKLGCHAYVADPDYQKCLDLISIFNQSS